MLLQRTLEATVKALQAELELLPSAEEYARLRKQVQLLKV